MIIWEPTSYHRTGNLEAHIPSHPISPFGCLEFAHLQCLSCCAPLDIHLQKAKQIVLLIPLYQRGNQISDMMVDLSHSQIHMRHLQGHMSLLAALQMGYPMLGLNVANTLQASMLRLYLHFKDGLKYPYSLDQSIAIHNRLQGQ